MTKEEIINTLNKLNIEKEKYLIIGDSALVFHNILEKSEKIEICYSKNSLAKGQERNTSITENNNIFIYETPTFSKNDKIKINDYNILSLEECYNMKLAENKKSNKKLLEKIDLALCSIDNTRYEQKLRKKNVKLIAGVDEVGRGPLVGPVVAACVILPDKFTLPGLTDSKKLTEKKRNILFEEIKQQAITYGIGVVDEKKIDEVNIYEATKIAMRKAIDNCSIKPEWILIDAMPLNLDIPTTSIIKGDLKSITISAASVIAKVTRDRMLYELDKKYPMYDFKNNKGYPTKKHIEAIEKYGIINEHRKSYEPVKKFLNHTEIKI